MNVPSLPPTPISAISNKTATNLELRLLTVVHFGMIVAEHHSGACQPTFLGRFEYPLKRGKESIIVRTAKEDQGCDQYSRVEHF
jgi:hypothetical protein